MIQNPPRKKAPLNPGPVGGAPGHLGRVRAGGALLLLGIIVRMMGTIALIASSPSVRFGDTLFLLTSSVFFVLAGLVSLSRPGWKQWPRGWGLLALLGLLAAEGLGVLGLMSLVAEHEVSAAFLLVSAHPTAMIVAAGGLLGHIYALLRPGASMRRLSAGVLGMVIFFLVCWGGLGAYAVATESEVAAIFTFFSMMPLPFLAVATSLIMMAQISLSRPQACAAVADGLAQAGLTALPAETLPDGARVKAAAPGVVVSVRLDDARLPLAFTVSVDLPPGMEGLRISRRTPRSRAPRLGDMVLDQLVAVEGADPAEIAGRLAEGHSAVLAIIHGRPGSGVFGGKIHLRAAIGAGLRILPGSSARQIAEMRALVTQSVEEVLALREVLSAGAARPAAEQRARAPEGLRV